MKFIPTIKENVPSPSLPSRERGLKSCRKPTLSGCHGVAPFAGAWIEIAVDIPNITVTTLSLPSRERGLKF